MSEFEHSGFLEIKKPEQSPYSSPRAELDSQFGGNNKEKLKIVNATLNRMRAQRDNLGKEDSVNYGIDEISRIDQLETDIAIYEAMQNELQEIIGETESKPEDKIDDLGKID